ncbi:site-specific DNA-methyltransferase [Anaerosalibacter bizertensis]|uniref:Site-specific DNA-methyltransferase n=1 Tax=Anaerosalibacter bizertensis TaxID=932217 RepID=A0A844FIT5_9FIRM|nr:site-specific DNA-methyltransferase [Anaerosalibacter bizertensis]MSS44023.1 site-specific DNA-methyltransferase [Anaerosalibacter bizertensis]
MEKINGESMDIERENIKRLKEIFPEVFTEDKIDFEKLQLILGEDIEESEERYSFNWNGKRDAIRLSQTPTTGTLRPDKDNSKNWDETENLYIEGDNLEVLKLLQKSYHGKIKMIYIDPPYNTGKDFVYKDNYRDNMKNYLEFTEQVDEEGHKLSTNTDTSGRYHTDWLNMMYPRLRLARNLLTDDGVIFISIDDNEVHNLRKICDEVFGEDNFVANFIWQKTYSTKNNNKYVSEDHDYILCFSKDIGKINQFNRLARTKESDRYYKYDDNDGRGLYRLDNITAAGQRGYDIEYNGKTYKEPYPSGWRFKEETMYKLIKDNRIYLPEDADKRPQVKRYLNEQEGLISKTILPYELVGHTDSANRKLFNLLQDKLFDYPKPVELMKYLCALVSNKDSIILDFFSGSSTTAHAVMDLNAEDGGNRKFIMVQLPEPTDEKSEAYKAGYKTIADIGRERIRRAGDKILEDNKDKEGIEDLDIGFKSFKLDSSNIKEWNPEYMDKDFTMENLVNNFVPNRNEEDILYEIILKYGIDLTAPIEEHKVNGKTIYNVGFGAIYICLDNHIDNDVVEEILKLNEENKMPNPMVVFKDTGFKNDEIKLNAKLSLNDNGIEEVVSI